MLELAYCMYIVMYKTVCISTCFMHTVNCIDALGEYGLERKGMVAWQYTHVYCKFFANTVYIWHTNELVMHYLIFDMKHVSFSF